jgi:pilus assembly protein Flp/PilA
MSGAVLAPSIAPREALWRVAMCDESGQGLAEYGLILGLVAILCIAAVLFLSGNIQGILSSLGSSI